VVRPMLERFGFLPATMPIRQLASRAPWYPAPLLDAWESGRQRGRGDLARRRERVQPRARAPPPQVAPDRWPPLSSAAWRAPLASARAAAAVKSRVTRHSEDLQRRALLPRGLVWGQEGREKHPVLYRRERGGGRKRAESRLERRHPPLLGVRRRARPLPSHSKRTKRLRRAYSSPSSPSPKITPTESSALLQQGNL